MTNSTLAFQDHGALVRILVPSRDNHGAYAIFDIETSGPILIPSHIHLWEDQWFHILAGQYLIQAGTLTIAASPGSVVEVRRNSTLAITSTLPGHFLLIALPGGLDLFLRDAQAATDTPALTQVLEKHGIVFPKS